MAFKNNVTRFLDSKNTAYHVYEYDYDAGIHSAVDVAAAIGLPPEQVFKTLVLLSDQADRKPILMLIPGPQQLDLKAAAKGTGRKKVKMASYEQAEAMTGLKTGGISPLALINQGFDVYLSERANAYETIAVSAGQRGAQIELAVADLVKLTDARLIPL